jgi:hypothetical protein
MIAPFLCSLSGIHDPGTDARNIVQGSLKLRTGKWAASPHHFRAGGLNDMWEGLASIDRGTSAHRGRAKTDGLASMAH